MLSRYWERDGSVKVIEATVGGLNAVTDPVVFTQFKNSLFHSPFNTSMTTFSFKIDNDPDYIMMDNNNMIVSDMIVMRKLIENEDAIIWFDYNHYNKYSGIILHTNYYTTQQLLDFLKPSLIPYDCFDTKCVFCKLDLEHTDCFKSFIASDYLFEVFKEKFIKLMDDSDLIVVKELCPFNFQIKKTSNSQRLLDKIN